MKNIKQFVYGTIKSVLLSSVLLAVSCSNFIEINEDSSPKSGDAGIAISLGLKNICENTEKNNERTVMATKASNESSESFTDINFYARLSSSGAVLGTEDTLCASWKDVGEMQLSPYSKTFTPDTYDFMIALKNYGAKMTQTLSNKVLSAGSTTALNFSSLTCDPSGAQTGLFSVTVYYNSISNVDDDFKKYIEYGSSKYPAISIAVDSKLIATKDSSKFSINTTKDEDGNEYSISCTTATFTSAPVDEGFHIVTFTFTGTDGSIFVYPIPVYVQAGYLSKNTFYPFSSAKNVTQKNGTSGHKVTYNSNNTNADSKNHVFYEGSVLADAEALGFAGDGNKRFKEWNTQANGSGTSYKAGESVTLTKDITLYAQWAEFTKVTYAVNYKSLNYPYNDYTDIYIQQFESGEGLASCNEAFADFIATQEGSKLTFCGWDTNADGSGNRYEEGKKLSLTEDIILYAQWCGEKNTSGAYSGYYNVRNANQWNALMGAPFANKVSGQINVDVYVQMVNIESPALLLTSGKKFNGNIIGMGYAISSLNGVLFDEISEDAKISNLEIDGPVCNTNRGTIEGVTVYGVKMTGYAPIAKINHGTIYSCGVAKCTITGSKSSSCTGGICNENSESGVIEDCYLDNCTIDGESCTYAGGICGKNSGIIYAYDAYVSDTVVKGKSSGESYAGGFCGYNEGSIIHRTTDTKTNSYVDNVTVTGSDDESGYYGYVIGKNKTNGVNSSSLENPVDEKISVYSDSGVELSETILDTKTVTVDGLSRYEIKIPRTCLVSVTFTDTTENAASLDGYLSQTKSSSVPSSYFIGIQDIKSESITRKIYLEKGTYYVYLSENYVLGKNTGCSAKVVLE